jgi:hypothetical protein
MTDEDVLAEDTVFADACTSHNMAEVPDLRSHPYFARLIDPSRIMNKIPLFNLSRHVHLSLNC